MIEPAINILSVLLLIGFAQGIFLALAIIVRGRGNILANRFLSTLTIALSIGLLDGFMIESNYYLRYPFLFGAALPLNFIFGPLFYFYVKELTSPKSINLKWEQLCHLIPAVLLWAIYLISLLFFHVDTQGTVQQWILAKEGFGYTPSPKLRGFSISLAVNILLAYLEHRPLPDFNLALFFIIIQMAVYLFLSLKSIKSYFLRIKDRYSSIEKISLNWLRNLLIAFFFLWILFTFHFFFSSLYGNYRETVYLFYLLIAVIIYIMGFKGFMQPEIFSHLEDVQQSNWFDYSIQSGSEVSSQSRQQNASTTYNEKYKKSSLTNEQSNKIHRDLVRLMETERPFLNSELNLHELASRLLVSPNHLSQVINSELNKNFFDFVNEYRVKEAKKLLISSDLSHLSILGISMDAGFNSKSSFYSAFKKYTGLTPTQFIKSTKTSPSL